MVRNIMVVGLLVGSLLVAETANAQSGVVLPFTGPSAGAARNVVVRAARDHLELIPKSRVSRAARELGVNTRSATGRADIAAELNIDYFIAGSVRGRQTRLRVYGADGEQLARGNARRPIGAAGRADVARVVGELLDEAIEGGGNRRDREAEEREARQRERDERRAALDAEEEEALEEEDEDEPRTGPRSPLATVNMLFGVDARTRDLAVRLTDGRRRNYEAGIHPDITLQLQIHPLATKDVARGLYAQLDVGVGVGLSTVERDPSDPAIANEVDTTAWRFMFQAGYLAPFADDKARIGVLLGYGHDRFALGDNQTMPGASYNQFRVGLAASFAGYGTLMQTRIDLGYRFVLSAGEMATAFGETINGGAFDVGLSVGGFVESGFSYGVRFGYTRYSLDLAGDATDFTAESATDSSVNVGLQLGWAFE